MSTNESTPAAGTAKLVVEVADRIKAILRIGTCLFSRGDLAPWMLAELGQIHDWLSSQPRLEACA